MTPDLEKSIVLITSSNPEIPAFGTGFVIYCDEQAAFIITCQHVVRDVGKEHVYIEGHPATVVTSGVEGETADDMVVLRVEGLQHLPPLPLSICGQQGLDFDTAGYCLYNKQYKLERLQGMLGKEVWLQSRGQTDRTRAWELSMAEGSTLQRGYSGAPIVERTYGLVLGIATHKEGQGQAGMAISIEVLQKIWSEMPSNFFPSPDIQAVTEKTPKRIAPNPFGERGRITNPNRFFDREDLFRQIFEELNKGVNISLVGESAVGKSSILSMVCEQGPTAKTCEAFEKLAGLSFIYFNVEWIEDEDDFYEALCDELGIESCRGYKLTRALRGKRYVLCLDEIEKMAWEGFTVKVRSHLRGLADGPDAPFKLVIASRSPLARLFPDSPELDSPLAGICRQLDVKPFSPEVARKFLLNRLEGTGVSFKEEQINKLISKTEGHPAKLQDEAATLYRKLMRGA